MNCDTGHLIDVKDEELRKNLLGVFGEPESINEREKRLWQEELEKKAREAGYEPVPQELNKAAQKVLAGRPEAHVSLTSGGKLSKWASKKRKEKRKAVAASRKRNR